MLVFGAAALSTITATAYPSEQMSKLLTTLHTRQRCSSLAEQRQFSAWLSSTNYADRIASKSGMFGDLRRLDEPSRA